MSTKSKATIEKKNVRVQNQNLKKFGIHKPPAKPTPEQKRAGWERKKEAQKIMDMVMQFSGMTVGALRKLAQKKGDDLTVLEARIIKYVSNDKYLIDWLDRHIPKAPQKTEITGEDGGAIRIDKVHVTIDKK